MLKWWTLMHTMSLFCLDFVEAQEKKRGAAHRLCFPRSLDSLTSVGKAFVSRGWAWSSLPPAPLPRTLLLHQPLEVEACRPASLPHAVPYHLCSRRRKAELDRNLPEDKLTCQSPWESSPSPPCCLHSVPHYAGDSSHRASDAQNESEIGTFSPYLRQRLGLVCFF